MLNTCAFRAITIALIGFFPIAFATADTTAIDRPIVQVGDRWKFDLRDGWTNLPINSTDRIITAVGTDFIEATENGNQATYSLDMNPIETPENRFEPAAKVLQFPMSVGSKWSYEGKTVIKANGVTGRSQYVVVVAGMEKITVPAGSFDAYKLDMEGYFSTNALATAASSSFFKRIYWYSPSLKSFVKVEHQSKNSRWVSELTETNLNP